MGKKEGDDEWDLRLLWQWIRTWMSSGKCLRMYRENLQPTISGGEGFYPKDGSSRFNWKVGTYVPNYTATNARRRQIQNIVKLGITPTYWHGHLNQIRYKARMFMSMSVFHFHYLNCTLGFNLDVLNVCWQDRLFVYCIKSQQQHSTLKITYSYRELDVLNLLIRLTCSFILTYYTRAPN